MSRDDRQALEALNADKDLDKLEKELDRFNIFEAIGVTTHEIRHSNFLAFLLNPQEKHGKSAAFVRRLLERILASAQDQKLAKPPQISIDDLNGWNLNALEVKREWEHIDIFLKDNSQKATITIENKVDSLEGEQQLKTYRERVESKFAGWRNLYVYLTRPGGQPPKDNYYIHIHYGSIIECLEGILPESSA